MVRQITGALPCQECGTRAVVLARGWALCLKCLKPKVRGVRLEESAICSSCNAPIEQGVGAYKLGYDDSSEVTCKDCIESPGKVKVKSAPVRERW